MTSESDFVYKVNPKYLLSILDIANRMNLSPSAAIDYIVNRGLMAMKGAPQKAPAPEEPQSQPQVRAAVSPAPAPKKRGRSPKRPNRRIVPTPPAVVPGPPHLTNQDLPVRANAVLTGDYGKCAPGEAARLARYVLRLALQRPIGCEFYVEDLFEPSSWSTLPKSLRLSVAVRVSNAVRFSGADVRNSDNTKLLILHEHKLGKRARYKIVKFTTG